MPDFKPWQWGALIGLLLTLNLVVIGGLLALVASFGIWTDPDYLYLADDSLPTATTTATRRPTFTATYTPEVWPTPTASRTPTVTPFPTPTWTPLPTRTWPGTATPVPADPATPVPTPNIAPTRTRVPTRTPKPTFTPAQEAEHKSDQIDQAATATFTPLPPLTPMRPVNAVVAVSGPPMISISKPSPTPAPSPTVSQTATASPTATASRTPTPVPPSATPSSTPSPTRLPVETKAGPEAEVLIAAVPTRALEENGLIRAIPEQDDSVSLAWEPATQAVAYRVYSDMGTGYGLYLFKGETKRPTLTDTSLRPALRYQYRIETITRAGDSQVEYVSVTTPGRQEVVSADSMSNPVPPSPTAVNFRVTPAPTPLPADTVILGLLSATDHLDNTDGHLLIVGELRNDTNLDVGQTQVTATFFGRDGLVTDIVSGETILHVLAPGERSPFIITLQQPLQEFENYSLRATGRPVTMAAGSPQPKVINLRRFEDDVGLFHVSGVIENQSQRRIDHPRVIVTLYDRGGQVVNIGFAYPKPSSLAAGSRADFDAIFAYYPKVFSQEALVLTD